MTDAPPADPESPLVDLGRRKIKTGWINSSGHMRAAQYVVVFEEAIGGFLDAIGCSAADIARTRKAPVLTEMHVCYRRELGAGATVAISLQVLGLGERSVHVFLRMTEAERRDVAASVELGIVNLGLDDRRAAPWSGSQLATLAALAEAHGELPRPAEAGRSVGAA